jgi:hypothetical protein
MKRYRVRQTIVLGFLGPQDQEDRQYQADTETIVECDGKTIFVVERGKREESITVADAVPLWVEQHKLEEITDE